MLSFKLSNKTSNSPKRLLNWVMHTRVCSVIDFWDSADCIFGSDFKQFLAFVKFKAEMAGKAIEADEYARDELLAEGEL